MSDKFTASSITATEDSSCRASNALSQSTSCVAVSPARTSPRPANVSASTVNGQDSGANTFESFASWDRITCSWRTSQLSFDEDSTVCLATWPRSGLMRNGKCSALTTSARASTANASGYWHTPTTRDHKGQSGRGNRVRRGKNGKLHIANLCDQLVDFGRPDLVRSPTFREWLMGLPIGHTVCEHSATRSSRKLRNGSGTD